MAEMVTKWDGRRTIPLLLQKGRKKYPSGTDGKQYFSLGLESEVHVGTDDLSLTWSLKDPGKDGLTHLSMVQSPGTPASFTQGKCDGSVYQVTRWG